MAIIPENKQYIQANDGDSRGNVFATKGIDFDKNRGTACVSNSLKEVVDNNDDADLDDYSAAFAEYNGKIWAVSDVLFESSTSAGVDITDGANWSQDNTGSSPTVGNTVTDMVVFDGLLLVVDGNDIKSYNGSSWASWWQGTLGQSALTIGQTFILKVAADGNLYITDSGNKVYRVDPSGTVTKTGEGTLDFSATQHILKCAGTTSSRIFYGTEDSTGENAVIYEWDMGPQSISPNRVHEMGVKRVLCIAVWDDTPIAILSDGTIKYFNGSAFVNLQGQRLPKTKNGYQDDIIHKNGWAIIDNVPHFLLNPTVDIDGTSLVEDTSNNWFYPAGVYCLDPEVGFYCRYPLVNDDGQHHTVSSVGALYARGHKNTKFFAGYELRSSTTSLNAVIACEDGQNARTSKAWLIYTPFESVENIVKKITVTHRRLDTGDSIKFYYRRFDEPSIRVTGNWASTTTLNTTDDITGLEKGWVGFVKSGTDPDYFSTVDDFTAGTTSEITFKDATTAATETEAIIELVNFKHFGTISNKGKEVSDFTIPQPEKSRQVWVWVVLEQAAGNNVQLDYLLTQ